MTDADFWQVERSLWLKGAEAFRAWVAPDCVMVFPEPVGILSGEAILDGVVRAPRWQRLEISAAVLRRAGSATVLLAYRAEAHRGNGETHRALCSSAYVHEAGDWWLVLHQQTPLAPAGQEERQR
jgi:hypothetical protein